jgi:hypothetical protein
MRELNGRRSFVRPWAGLVTGLIAIGMAGAIHAAQTTEWVAIAEGFTSGGRQGIDVAYHKFATSDVTQLCAAAPAPSTLVAATPTDLEVGRVFTIADIVVVTRSDSGDALAGVPIVLEVHDLPMLNLASGSLLEGKIQPIRPGHFQLRVRTLCPGLAKPFVIQAVVWSR